MTVAAPRHPAFQRIGGSIGTALLALILQQQTRLASSCTGGAPSGLLQPVTPTLRAEVADPLAHAFTHTLGWSAPITAAAIILAAVQAWSAFRARLAELGIVHRRGGYRDPESQAFIESWFSKLKQRCIWREEFETLDDARAAVDAYVDRYHHRPHSRLAYRTPREVAATWKDHDDQSIPAA
jgi:hypothetical protein